MRKLIATMMVGAVGIAFAAGNSKGKKENNIVQDVKKTTEALAVANSVPETWFITAPDGWTQKDTMIEGLKQTRIDSPDDEPGDLFKESIIVSTEMASGYTLQSYGEASLVTIRNGVPGIDIADQGETTIGDIQAQCYIFTFNYSGNDLKDIAWYTVKNDVGYIITCTALKSTFDRFEPKFKACANSFRIK